MPTQVVCPNPNCRKPLALADDLSGRSVRCPHCRSSFRVAPSSASASQLESVAPEATALPAHQETFPLPAPASPPAAPAAAPPPAAREAGLPAAIGRYEVRKKLGEGAFGVVYQGHDPLMKRFVAIKVLKEKWSDSSAGTAAAQRFEREAEALGRMRHGNIVVVHDRGTHEGAAFIVSDFIEGPTLSSVVPENGLEPRRAVRLTLQLLDALTYAHKQGVLHRDIKPANALLDTEERLYLTDFGLAGWVSDESSRLTADGMIMGTPAYMSPEQAQGNVREVGPAADQYSAGVVLYELLTGRLPFDVRPVAALLYHLIHSPPPPPTQWRPDLPPQLEKICLKALAKQPEKRFPSCRAFADTLRAWLAANKTTVTGPAPEARRPGEPAPVPRETRMGERRSTVTASQGPSAVAPELLPVPPPAEPAPGMSRRTLLLVAFAGMAVPIIAAGAFVVVKSIQKADRREEKPTKDGLYRKSRNE